MIISKDSEMDNSYQNSEIYKSIPAVKVYEANAEEFYFNDSLKLKYQRSFFKKHFLGK